MPCVRKDDMEGKSFPELPGKLGNKQGMITGDKMNIQKSGFSKI